MVTARVLRTYKRLRREHVSPRYGLGSNQPRAQACLNYAKRITWCEENWGDFDRDGIATSFDGQWRMRIIPDEYSMLEDMEGDMFNPEHAGDIPGGKRTLDAERKEYHARLDRKGVWGYVLEKRVPPCPTCSNEGWEHIDSCFGFDGEVYEEARIDAQFQAKG